MAFLNQAISLSTTVFVVSSMLAVGLSLTIRQVVTPLRNVRLVALGLLVNFALMPMTAIAIARLLQLDKPLADALLLLAVAAGAPFLPVLTGIAKGDLAFSVGLMVLLMVSTVVYMPIALPVMLGGVSVDSSKIATSLVLLMLLPLGVGLIIRARRETTAARIQPLFGGLSKYSLILLIVLMLVANARNILSLYGSRGVFASILLLAAGSTLGWFLGGPSTKTRSVMALGTAQRNIAAALVVAKQNFSDPVVTVMVVVIAIVGLLLLFPFGRWLAKRSESHAGSR